MVRINVGDAVGEGPGRPSIDLGAAKLVKAHHSLSRPGSFHLIVALERPAIFKRFGGEVTIICTCPGFHNHRKCWHLDDMLFELSEEAPLEDEPEVLDECPHCGNPDGTHYEPGVCAMLEQDDPEGLNQADVEDWER